MTPHSRYNVIEPKMRELVSRGLAIQWTGIVYRYVPREYATVKKLMSGAGAFKAGGRWNAPNAFHAVYCASDPDLANREYFASCRTAGIPLYSRMPLVGMAVEVDLTQVLDLRDLLLLKRVGVSQSMLNADPWRSETDAGRESLCQVVGRTAKEVGIEALLVPPAQATKPDEYNLVLILENAPDRSGRWRVVKDHKE